MKDILKEAINEAEKIGRLRKPHYSQGLTHEEAVTACEELLERTHEKLKNFISVNNCVSGWCLHKLEATELDMNDPKIKKILEDTQKAIAGSIELANRSIRIGR